MEHLRKAQENINNVLVGLNALNITVAKLINNGGPEDADDMHHFIHVASEMGELSAKLLENAYENMHVYIKKIAEEGL